MPFDAEAGEALRLQWMARRTELEKALHEQFPGIENWNSRPQIAKLLVSRGWTPEKFTEKKKEPSIDDEALEELPAQFPEFTGLAEHFILGRRLGQLAKGDKAWLKHIGADVRIHGGIIHIGTPHSRAAHFTPNIAQVPNPKKGKPFATECRALFRTSNDWVFVSCDQAGLQDRGFSHYLAEFDGGAYAKAFLGGLDPHWAVVLALGLVPDGTLRDKTNKLHGALREGCKSWRYAFLFGMGKERAGLIIRNTIRAALAIDPPSMLMQKVFGTAAPKTGALKKTGATAIAKFIKATPGLKELRHALEKQGRRGWLPGLDGRRVPIRALYTALNYAVTRPKRSSASAGSLMSATS
jgi:hypothetical protein